MVQYVITFLYASILEIHISFNFLSRSKFNLKFTFSIAVIFALSFKVRAGISRSCLAAGRPEPFFFAVDLVFFLVLCFTLMMNCCCRTTFRCFILDYKL